MALLFLFLVCTVHKQNKTGTILEQSRQTILFKDICITKTAMVLFLFPLQEFQNGKEGLTF